ncbi:MAG: hypothetical protein ABI847_16850 [Anaerolineales bacterium]
MEILWEPLAIDDRTYCCAECWEGIPCLCGERQEFEERRQAAAGEGALAGGPAFELGPAAGA